MAYKVMTDDGKRYVGRGASGPFYPAVVINEPFGRRVWTDKRLL